MHMISTQVQTAKHYPNAANRDYFLNKITDIILSAAICVGVVAIGLFLITCCEEISAARPHRI